jgi:O-antigen ligase
MTIRRKLIHDAFTLAVLFLATAAFQSFLVDPTDPRASTDGSTSLQLVWFVVYVFIAFRLIPHYRQVIALLRANMCLLLLVLLAVSSIMWSQDPSLTLRKGVALVATTLIGIDFAIRYSVRDQLRLLCIVLGLIVLLGIVTELVFPALIPNADFDTKAWHGVMAFKNDWARIVVLAAVAWFSRPRRSARDYLVVASVTVVAFGLIALAHSAGALVILLALLLLSKISGGLRWKPKKLAAAGLASALVLFPMSYIALHNLDEVTAVLGRDASLTGRVGLWQLAISSIERNPIQGYGYSAFWSADSQAATRIREEMNWDAPHAHNGYIDLTLETGLTGLLLLMSAYLTAGRRAIDCLQRGVEREAMWPFVYLSFFILYQFTEGSLVTGNTIYWILFVAGCFSVTNAAGTDQQPFKSPSGSIASLQLLPLGQDQL